MPARFILAAIWLALVTVACQAVSPTRPPPTSPVTSPTPSPADSELPGPVVALALFPEGEILTAVGPIGDPDGGLTYQLFAGQPGRWRRLVWPEEATPRALRITPDGKVIFALPRSAALLGVAQPWGLMRSTDGGLSWHQALNGLSDPFVADVALSPAFETDRMLVAITWYNGAFASTDGGDSWQPMPYRAAIEPGGGANPHDLAVGLSPDFRALNQGTICASFGHHLRMWRTTRGAWQTVAFTATARVEGLEPAEAPLAAGAIAFSPAYTADGTIYIYSGYAGLLRSVDRGESWSLAGRGLPAPATAPNAAFQLAVLSADEAYVLLPDDGPEASEGGAGVITPASVLYRTRDGGRNWLALGRPLPAGGVSAFAISRGEQGKSLLYLGGARGGVLISPVDDLEWQ